MTSNHLADPRETILAAYARLSAKQQRLARFFLDNPYAVAFESANEISARVDVSPATVVRFCQALGYAGYPEFQESVRSRFPTALTAVERGEQALGTGEQSPGWTLSRVFDAEMNALQRTRDGLRLEDVEAAARAIQGASQVMVLGAGVAAGPAVLFAHTLRMIGVDARHHVAGGLPLAVDLANAPAGSVLVTISVWRYVRALLDATLAARARGLRCIALVDSAISPLFTQADIAFVTATGGVAHLLSLSGIMATLNMLAIAVSQLQPDETIEALRRVDEQYRAAQLLLSD